MKSLTNSPNFSFGTRFFRAPAGFRNPHVHTNRVTWREVRQIIAQSWFLDEVDPVHGSESPGE